MRPVFTFMDFESLNPTDLGLCPCGGKIYADTDQCAVIHEIPYCKPFRDLEPDKFLAYVRRSRGIADN
jgi:hypothetical protein